MNIYYKILNEIAASFDMDQWNNQNNIFTKTIDNTINGGIPIIINFGEDPKSIQQKIGCAVYWYYMNTKWVDGICNEFMSIPSKYTDIDYTWINTLLLNYILSHTYYKHPDKDIFKPNIYDQATWFKNLVIFPVESGYNTSLKLSPDNLAGRFEDWEDDPDKTTWVGGDFYFNEYKLAKEEMAWPYVPIEIFNDILQSYTIYTDQYISDSRKRHWYDELEDNIIEVCNSYIQYKDMSTISNINDWKSSFKKYLIDEIKRRPNELLPPKI